MARQTADSAYQYRAEVTETTTYADGREPYTFTTYYGPYIRAGMARTMLKREQRIAEQRNAHAERYGSGNRITVMGSVQRAETVWSEVTE
jgi:hypothetical protein